MGIVTITTDVAGQIDVKPRRVKIITTDSLSTVTTAGYFNAAAKETGFALYKTDIVDMIYGYSTTTKSGTYDSFTVSISEGVITFTQFVPPFIKKTGTESSNAVTVNAQAGVITTSSLSTAGGSSYAITWTNSFINSSSSIQLTIMGGTNTTENITLTATAGSGTSTLTIYNNTSATALNGTILIGFLVV